MILDDIVAVKLREVAGRKIKTPLSALKTVIEGMPPTRDFRRAIGNGDCAIIAEVKRRSPSRGLFKQISIPSGLPGNMKGKERPPSLSLRMKIFFGGSNADLTAVKGAISLPVLRKEFIIDPWQIHETRAIGADALLLIAAILERISSRHIGNSPPPWASPRSWRSMTGQSWKRPCAPARRSSGSTTAI